MSKLTYATRPNLRHVWSIKSWNIFKLTRLHSVAAEFTEETWHWVVFHFQSSSCVSRLLVSRGSTPLLRSTNCESQCRASYLIDIQTKEIYRRRGIISLPILANEIVLESWPDLCYVRRRIAHRDLPVPLRQDELFGISNGCFDIRRCERSCRCIDYLISGKESEYIVELCESCDHMLVTAHLIIVPGRTLLDYCGVKGINVQYQISN